MNAAEQLREAERLTWPEICSLYPDQYVCLIEVDRLHPRDLDFHTARVVGHGKTRREALDQASPFCDTDTEIAFRFTGQIKYVRPALILDDQTRDATRSRG